MNKNFYQEAKKYIPGGVDSPVRAFCQTGVDPIFIKSAKGKYLYSENGKKYLDFCMSWGAVILGHASEIIEKQIIAAIKNGTSYGMPTFYETRLAKLIIECMPSIEKIRFVNSGTEAVMSALRLSKAFTKKNKIIKFDGCYHGHYDALLVNAGSGVAEIANASSKGISQEIIANTISLPLSDKETVEKIIKKNYKDIACIIVEPIPANMGLIKPDVEFLVFLRKITKQYDILLIFDEVISGFRVNIKGAQGVLGIKPDLTTLGKIIGAGFPVGAFGGRAEIMNMLAPDGEVYQAGTLSGNPVAMIAGYAVLKYLKENPKLYSDMCDLVADFVFQFKEKSRLTIHHYTSMFTIFYTKNRVTNYADVKKQDINLFKEIYKRLLKNNILFPPSMYETSFISPKHNMNDLKAVIEVFSK